MKNKKNLIVYYSRTGNTAAVANIIHQQVGGDIVQLETTVVRPSDYETEVAQNQSEQNQAILPALKTKIDNFSTYDVMFIGTPTWNMALPQAVVTFLNDYNLSGKTVIPFNTNGGYGSGNTFTQIQSKAKGAKVLKGFSVQGGKEKDGVLLSIKDQREVVVSKEIDNWLVDIGQIKK
ncbi:flavodoxin family protein [Convivina praedatoris]|uniref:Flavodoxin-like domain-containing protein n=1 Tax=Convivina praedatoris TaxID=2880963 RepID=A0ABN8H869_9LACO|nr:flavodoxin [Convivina sp. LMG 32447]CAH1851948.1 hypothetical protein LMG032447_00447 [Convivina sp. LMG 32447]CAH1851982.1 hypothetical protein R078138_00457 [Convivina sp. LMG 32447]CAH1852933.1 hypothetical protein R077815_00660 [Convivina sp. LMG 32447]